jgi:hypothetical protein
MLTLQDAVQIVVAVPNRVKAVQPRKRQKRLPKTWWFLTLFFGRRQALGEQMSWPKS